MTWEAPCAPVAVVTVHFMRRGRWARRYEHGRFRYYVDVFGVYVRVPWLAWAMFA